MVDVFVYELTKDATINDSDGRPRAWSMFGKQPPQAISVGRPLGPAMLGERTEANSAGHDRNWRPSQKFRLVQSYKVKEAEAPEATSFAEEYFEL